MQQMTGRTRPICWFALCLALLLPLRSATAETIQLQKEGGTYRVSRRINGAVTVDFIFDTAASDVSLPETAVQALTRVGKLDRSDYGGTRTHSIGDGSTVS